MKKRKIAFILAFAIALPLLFSGAIMAEDEDIPTIFINNEAWYKNSLLPLMVRDGEQLVPISVFSAFDHITISYKEAYNCYLIESDDGKFISVSTENGRYLAHTGERGDITVLTGESELYISARITADILGLGLEEAVFYDKNVLRFHYDKHLESLEILIDYYISASDSFIGSAGIGGSAIRRETFSFFADLSDMKAQDIRTLLDAASEQGISMTFAIPSGFAAGRKNQALLFEIAAAGHTLAISIDNESMDDPLTQAKKCNSEIYSLLKKKTLLVLTSGGKNELRAVGYTILNNSFRISGTSGSASVNFTINDMIFFDKVNEENIAKFNDIISEAKSKGRTVTAINALAGN
ncbi:MAG: hypothetical protein IJZ89_07635 [Clostridia bacterium]|nr:hypothetical protein [Clostridia bacterium]